MNLKLVTIGILACLLCPATAQRVVKLTATPPDGKFSVSITQGEPYERYIRDADWNLIEIKTAIDLTAIVKGGGGYNYRPILFQDKGTFDINYYVPTVGADLPRVIGGLEYNWTTDSPELIQIQDPYASPNYIAIDPPSSLAGFTVTATNPGYKNSAKASIAIWAISVEGEAVDQKLEAFYYPASKQLELKSEDISLHGKKLMLAIFNPSGILMHQDTQVIDNVPFQTTLNLQHLQTGVYFLSVQHNSGRFSYSFIVK